MPFELPIPTKAERLADQLRRTIEGDPWHGPSWNDTLQTVSAEQALWRPPGEAHTIWEIAAHVAFWHDELLPVVGGEPYRNVSETEQWPASDDTSEEAWAALLMSIESSNEALADAVAELTDAQLALPMENRDYDLEFLIQGLVQHNAYHAGQVALLKRLAS
jgi:uncharacterized damage-inducible protein DinB